MAKEDLFLKWLGIIFMILGGIAVFSALPTTMQSVVSVGPVEISGVSELSATRLAVGAVLFGLGYAAYRKK